MFQVVFDNKGSLDFGDRILQFFLQREAQNFQKEQLKIQKGEFKLKTDAAEVEAKTRADQGVAAIRQLMGLAGTQAGQAAGITAESTAGLTGGQAAAFAPLAAEQTRDVAQIARGEAGLEISRGQAAEEVRHNTITETSANRRIDIAERAARAAEAATTQERDRDFSRIALEGAKRDVARWESLSETLGPREAAIRLFGGATLPTEGALFKRNLELLQSGNGDIAALIIEETPLQRASNLGMHTAIQGAVARLQARGDPATAEFEGLSNEEAVTKLANEIDSIDDAVIEGDPAIIIDPRQWKEEQKAVLLEWFRIELDEDTQFGAAILSPPVRKKRLKDLLKRIGALTATPTKR